jgi:N-terminal acetyltransferase 2
MLRNFIPRFHLLKAIFPRIRAPILPTTRLRPPASHIPHYNSRLFHFFPSRLTNSPPPSPHPSLDPLPPNTTLSYRLKHLIKSYGWYALGVYLLISALDLGVAFAGVNLLGAEYVSQVATNVKAAVTSIIHSRPSEPGKDQVESATPPSDQRGQEGLYAMLVLAYTIHKTLFFPFRVGITAALTPKLVGWLGQRGWVGSAGTRRAAVEMRERLREGRSRNS